MNTFGHAQIASVLIEVCLVSLLFWGLLVDIPLVMISWAGLREIQCTIIWAEGFYRLLVRIKGLLLKGWHNGMVDGLRAGIRLLIIFSCIFFVIDRLTWLLMSMVGPVLVRVELGVWWDSLFDKLARCSWEVLYRSSTISQYYLATTYHHSLRRRNHILECVVTTYPAWILNMVICSFKGLDVMCLILDLRRRVIRESLWRWSLPK